MAPGLEPQAHHRQPVRGPLLAVLSAAGTEGLVERLLPAAGPGPQPHPRQVRVGQAEQRTSQHGRHLDVPVRVVQDLQEVEAVLDLHRLEEARRRGDHGHARPSQEAMVFVRPAGRRAEQDHDVTIPDGPRQAGVRVADLQRVPAARRCHHPLDPLRYQGGLTLAVGDQRALRLLCRVGEVPGLDVIEDVQFHGRPGDRGRA